MPLLDAMTASFCSCVRYALVSSHGGSSTGGGASRARGLSQVPFVRRPDLWARACNTEYTVVPLLLIAIPFSISVICDVRWIVREYWGPNLSKERRQVERRAVPFDVCRVEFIGDGSSHPDWPLSNSHGLACWQCGERVVMCSRFTRNRNRGATMWKPVPRERAGVHVVRSHFYSMNS